MLPWIDPGGRLATWRRTRPYDLHDQPAAAATVDAILADNGAAVTVRADELHVERLFAETIAAFRQGETAGERAMWAITGLVSVALGIVLFMRPDIGALSLATVFGLFSIFFGTSALILSFQAWRLDAAARRLVDSAA